MKLLERNSIINISIISLSIYLGYTISLWNLLLWPLILIVDDIFYYSLKLSLFDPELRVQRTYQFVKVFLNNQTGKGRDLEFGLYDGDLQKSKTQAQIDKWETMLNYLKLSPGDSLIDVGCGFGDWLNYAKSKGIHVVGINMSVDQVNLAKSLYPIDILCTNWKTILIDPSLQEKVYGKFDAVTFMGSVEHFVPNKYRNNPKLLGKIYSDMFLLARNLLKKNSPSSRILISCLHGFRSLKTWREYLGAYFIDKHCCGHYPYGDDGLTKFSTNYFKELARFDKTEDYRIASVLDPDHFGCCKIHWDFKKILHSALLILLDPCHIHKLIESKATNWMYTHFGKDAWECSYGKEHQKQQRAVNLWWLLLEKKEETAFTSGK